MNFLMFRYIAGTYFKNFLAFLAIFLAIIYLFDSVELLRRGSKFDDVSLGLVLRMSFFKLPEVGQIMFPFAVLFSAIFTFWQLNKRSELIVLRASGFSIWQFLSPAILCVVAIGFFQIFLINPAGALFVQKFERMEGRYLKRETTNIALFEKGLWLRQNDRQDPSGKSYIVLHAPEIAQAGWVLKHPFLLYFDDQNRLIKRVDSESGTLQNGEWIFPDAVLHETSDDANFSLVENEEQEPLFEKYEEYIVPTKMTRKDVADSFLSPSTISFWNFPKHIRMIQRAGFDATNLKVYYQSLWAQPFMFVAMIFLAAAVSMRSIRSKGGFLVIVAGVFLGFGVFFMSSYLQALGASDQIPYILAAWAPALITFLIGISVLIRLEDG